MFDLCCLQANQRLNLNQFPDQFYWAVVHHLAFLISPVNVTIWWDGNSPFNRSCYEKNTVKRGVKVYLTVSVLENAPFSF